ncbi:hypothetical protein ACWA7J_10510 [Leptothrix sp. BB-4]
MNQLVPTSPSSPSRRRCLIGAGAAAAIGGLGLAACSGPPTRPDDAPPPGSTLPSGPVTLQHWRSYSSGPLALPGAGGLPTLPGLPGLAAPQGGPPVRLLGPVALALRAGELLVADAGLGRLVRISPSLPAWTVLPPIAGLAITPRTVLAIGPDASLWALDGPGRQLLNLSPGGQLIRRIGLGELASPVGFVLAGIGNRLLVADDSSGRWFELRGATWAEPWSEPAPGAAADAIAASRDTVYLLERRLARVRRVDLRDGRALDVLGDGELRQPVALAADARGRVAVLDAQQRAVWLHVPGQPAQWLSAADLRVQQPAALAMDDGWLAVADRLGSVQLFRLIEGGR